MLQRIKEEPALVLGLLQAVVALVIAFGLRLTEEQIGAIVAFSALALALVTRQAVTPLARK
jgi:hypothetical protein